MKAFRFVLALFMLAVVLLGGGAPAQAATVTQLSVDREDATIPWLFAVESFCSYVPEGVSISPDDNGSDQTTRGTQQVMADGTTHIVISTLIKGTASDNLGGSYHFVYHNVSTYNFNGSVVDTVMIDTFSLKGDNASYTVGFNWRWAYPATSLGLPSPTADELFAEPFVFPTADGSSEVPEIVPGSWQQITTQGDAFNCDPL